MLTTVVWQSAAVTAGLLVVGMLPTLVNIRRASKRSRPRIAALRQALAALDGVGRAAGTTPTGGTVLAFRIAPGPAQFELRHLRARQFARYSTALQTGAPATLRAHSIIILSDHIATREPITLRIPAGPGRARHVTEHRPRGPWGCLRVLGGAVLGTMFATPEELDDLLHAMTTGLLGTTDSPAP